MLTRLPQILLATTMILAVGCDDRATRIALQSADQQARQNLAMAQVNEHVADGTKQLLAADANSRRELLAAHRELLMASTAYRTVERSGTPAAAIGRHPTPRVAARASGSRHRWVFTHSDRAGVLLARARRRTRVVHG